MYCWGESFLCTFSLQKGGFLGFPLFSQRPQCFYTLQQVCRKYRDRWEKQEQPEILTNYSKEKVNKVLSRET